MKEIMENKKLRIALIAGAVVLVLVIVLLCAKGGKGSSNPATLEEQPVTITELDEDGLTGSYTDASGRTRTVTVTTDVTTTVQDINGQEIGMDELLVTNTVQLKLDAEGKAESILLLPDTSDEYC